MLKGSQIKPGRSISDASEDCAKEWSARNERSASEVTAGSNKKYWWVCSTCGNEWQATPTNRIGRSSGCPLCARKRVGVMSRANAVRHDGTFFDAIPELLIEWDKSRNSSLNPEDFSPKSSNKVWWKCVRGHSWETTIASRTSGSNCPRCVLHGKSHIELR